MPLGTLDRSPPPMFRQGPSALTKLVFFAAAAVFLMAADTRLALIKPLRAGLATALHPVQRAMLVPIDLVGSLGDYTGGLQRARADEATARTTLARQAERVARADVLAQENAQLRALLDLRPRLEARSQAASVLYEAADPYSRKVIIDKGSAQGIVAGAPVINEVGVLGQVTRLYPLSAEVTLLTDKDAAIPVLNVRTGQRSAAQGVAGGGALELRYLAGNADIQVGDVLTTSGVDAVYPAGLPVATVSAVERRSDAGFARILLAPTATPDAVRHVLVLEPVSAQLPPRPVPVVEATAATRAASAASKKDKAAPP